MSRLLQDEIQTKEVRRLALWFASRPGARRICEQVAWEIQEETAKRSKQEFFKQATVMKWPLL